MLRPAGDSPREFEFDAAKSALNERKHGIDFVGAQLVWRDPDAIGTEARHEGEPRWIAVGLIGRKHRSVVFTRRKGGIRIISARRARIDEVARYEQSRREREEDLC